jgi:hypothetical protein
MKNIALALALLLPVDAQTPKPTEPPALAKLFDGAASYVEGEVLPAAESMPEDKFDFAPTAGEFKGVRTFAQQVKHIAVCNYMAGSGILVEKMPVDPGPDGNGSAALKSKAQIVQFLKDSFAYAHKAILTINDQNAMATIKAPWGGDITRLRLATIVESHGFDHYGQMVVYLRMNGIVPPASRK